MARSSTLYGWRSLNLQKGTNYKGRLIWDYIWRDLLSFLLCPTSVDVLMSVSHSSFTNHSSTCTCPFRSAHQTLVVPQPQETSWPHTLSSLPPWKEWHHFALVVVVWSVFQAEAPLQPSLLLLYVCWRLLLMCLLWLGLGGCVYFLKCCFQKQVSVATNWAESCCGLSSTKCDLFCDFASVHRSASSEAAAGG